MVELRYMRFWAICTAAIMIGFVSGASLAVPFFAPETIVYFSSPTPTSISTDTCTDGNSADCVPTTEASSSTAEPSSSSTPSLPLPTTQTEFNSAVSFLINEQKLFPDGLIVLLTAIADSRCKADVQCIWAGELSPQLTLTGGDFGTSSISISLGTSRSQALTSGSYTFTIGTTTTDTATVKVVKKQPATTAKSSTKATTVVTPATPKPVTTAIKTQPATTFAEDVASLITIATKKFRIEQSLSPFTVDTALAASAKKYSSILRTGNYLAHIDKSGCDLTCRFDESNYQAQSWGENLAMMEFEEQPTAQYVANFFMTEWKKSAGHRKNLLSPTFTHQGIGVSLDADSIYVTVHFALPN
jgi:uncharacterized protein YkwD